MDFRLLGPLEVRAGGVVVALGSPKHRILLAALLLDPGRTVTTTELVEAIWGDEPPGNPRRAIQLYVTRLRSLLGGAVTAPIVTGNDGYRLDVTPDEIDLGRFQQWLAEADRAAERGDLDKEATALAEALSEWRGEPLADTPSEMLQREVVPRLREQRLLALERRIDVDLRTGRHAELVAELRALTAQHPLRERMWAQLVAALDGSGRRGEALGVYHEARRGLVDALGVEPGEELQERYAAVLKRRPVSIGRADTPPVPRQLPPDVPGFAGRDAELAELDALAVGTVPSGTVVISAIAGTAGVGKTALAAHWARRVADEFPDGQLWVNLRGYDPGQSVPPEQALTMFLCAMGVPQGRIPLDLDGLSGLFRSLLDGRRMLMVLDNANGPEQVRPLLPGAPGSLVLVTSRDDLAGLVARDGAARLRLDLLGQRESVELLRRLLGRAVVDSDPAAADELVRLCARLPLALRIAAERVILGGGRLSRVVAELAGERRLDGLSAGGDPYTALRSVFSWSYRALPPDAAALFRSFGLVPGADWDAYAAAALAGVSLADGQRLLDVLVRAHLVEDRGEGRFTMHDLLRAYAAEHARDVDAETGRHAALTRLFDFYLGTASKAMDVAFPYERHRRPSVAAPATPVPQWDDAQAATGWLDTERPNLAAVVPYAADHGWPGHAMRLAKTLARYLTVRAANAEAMAIHGHALRAAVQTGDRAGEGIAGRHLGDVLWLLARYPEAQGHFQRALAIFREVGDRVGEAMALDSLGMVDSMQGRNEDALQRFQRAAAIIHEIGDRQQEARVLNNLGIAHVRLGRDGEALAFYERGLVIAREVGDRPGEANLLNGIAYVHKRRGDNDRAYEHYRRALALSREIGDRNFEVKSLGALGTIYIGWGRFELAHETFQEVLDLVREAGDRAREADTWAEFGNIYLRWGRHDESAQAYKRSLEMAREVGFRPVEVAALNGLGDVARASGRPAAAREHHLEALDLGRASGDPHEQARALDGLGDAHHDLGDPAAARQAWQGALERYTELGAPAAAAVKAKLGG